MRSSCARACRSCVARCSHTDHYWQVYFETNRVIREVGSEGAYPPPKQHLGVQSNVKAA